MPIHPPEHDAANFAARLKQAMEEAGESAGRGAGVLLAKRYKASTVTANAWLNGTHMPSPDRARMMADDYGVAFDWLYFGKGPKRPRKVEEEATGYQAASLVSLSPRERALLENYRAADESTKNVVDAAAAAGAQLPNGHKDGRRGRKRA